MSCCEIYIAKVRQGLSFSEDLYFKDEDGNSFDLSTKAGTAHIRQDGATLLSVSLVLSFTDTESPNIEFSLSSSQVLGLEIGVYEVIFIVDGEEIPEDGQYKLEIKEAL